MSNLNITKHLHKAMSTFLMISLTIPIILSFASLNIVYAGNNISQQKTIRIGLSQNEFLGSTETDEKLFGYFFEYFATISNYVNWEYEYISGTPAEIMALAENGKIDLIGGITKSEENQKLFDFPEIENGKSYITISATADNQSLDVYNYNTFNGMTVGIIKNSSKSSKEIDEFCAAYNLTMNKRYFDSSDELWKALSEGAIDSAIGSDIPISVNTKIIARFSPVTHYIVALKNNGLINELNYALTKIDQNNEDYSDKLYRKYYQVPDYSKPTFSEEEISFAKKSIKIRVSVPPDMYPMAYVDRSGKNSSGISRNILAEITSLTGLQFEYVKAKSVEDAIQMASSGKTDMTACILHNFWLSQQYNLKLTIPYSEVQNVMITSRPLSMNELKLNKLAQLKGSTIATSYDVGEVVAYDRMIDCIDAVRRGEADFTFCNLNTTNILLDNINSKNLITTSKLNDMCSFSFGLNQYADKHLLSIIEKMILSSEYTGYNNSINNNDIIIKPKSLTDFVHTHPNEVIMAILIAAILIVIMFFFTMHSQIKQNRTLTEYGKTYKTLADSAGEISFVYYLDKDLVSLFGRNSMQFSTDNQISNFKTMLLQSESPFTTLTYEEFCNAITTAKIGANYSAELEIALTSGIKKWFRVIYTVISNTHSIHKPSRVIGRFYDIDKERKEHDLLLSISELDPLTGLFNRHTAEKRVSQILQSDNYNTSGIICLIDVDHFKQCNDKYGHQVGDEILKYLSNILKSTFDQNDIICRWGGDEFWIFSINNKSVESITKKIEFIQNLMLKFELNNKPLPITLSVGGVSAHKGISLDVLFKMADDTLYEVKRSGRNGFVIH